MGYSLDICDGILVGPAVGLPVGPPVGPSLGLLLGPSVGGGGSGRPTKHVGTNGSCTVSLKQHPSSKQLPRLLFVPGSPQPTRSAGRILRHLLSVK